MSLLVIFETLGLFVNTLTVDNNSSLCNSENLQQPIQMTLSKKQKPFLNFLLHFWNLNQILNILEKKDDPHGLYISEITDGEGRGY